MLLKELCGRGFVQNRSLVIFRALSDDSRRSRSVDAVPQSEGRLGFLVGAAQMRFSSTVSVLSDT